MIRLLLWALFGWVAMRVVQENFGTPRTADADVGQAKPARQGTHGHPDRQRQHEVSPAGASPERQGSLQLCAKMSSSSQPIRSSFARVGRNRKHASASSARFSRARRPARTSRSRCR